MNIQAGPVSRLLSKVNVLVGWDSFPFTALENPLLWNNSLWFLLQTFLDMLFSCTIFFLFMAGILWWCSYVSTGLF